ncbi:hypothetical protein CVIRNUC_000379 [Coccomyxa viridis]|uniref:Uncharacterized protein n=1 Tax=Coccomyxa viridis TaxID=1274662 RepID=A0AAV1HTL8_9CHLO|nr:hypothetical protein CVIRNUC_000379 [Coccomyxa viridis]
MKDAVKVHWLPCTVGYAGSANVGAYFLPKHTGSQSDGYAVEEAHFRGRQLKGTTLQLPDNYTGQVLLKQHVSDEGSQWASQATFTSFTAWKHGVQALKTDSAQRRLDYLRICQQMHAPVSKACLERELADNTFAKGKH